MAKYEYTVIFRNGYQEKVKADGFETETGVTDNDHTTMKYIRWINKDTSGGEPLIYFSLDDVIAISAKELTLKCVVNDVHQL
ncbi:hypothetical protein PN4B1_16880 [Paenibacillus naphthalenovorans]|uniref:hypothetical protein n=1 Tax=Paenibacillus naphthalenovorans TaxID=162209 RepID=UPI0010B57A7F|nr:hypothetical protein [Paenibacillus naphthalenovorans]GCL71783.1 hypothetical protein PN4B1_16880 [Paenibacillus naphthalenovorans]